MATPRRRPSGPVVLELPALVHGLPAPPPASLDPFLDAAAGCFARYGIQRTSVQDVAQAMRVNRTTVYRQVGNVESMLRLFAARELHRMLRELPRSIGKQAGPETVIQVVVAAVELARAHPVVAKVLADERELLGAFLEDFPEIMGRIATAIVPVLDAAMAAGHLARRDPIVVAEWLTRIGVTAILAPPPGDLDVFLRELLLPALQPGGDHDRST